MKFPFQTIFVTAVVLLPSLCLPSLARSSAKPMKAVPVSAVQRVPFSYDPVTLPDIVVRARINGGPPLAFILDTGSEVPLLIAPWAAKASQIEVKTVPLRGYLNGQPVSAVTTVGHLSVPGSTVGSSVSWPIPASAFVVNLDFLQATHYDVRIAGLIGLPAITAAAAALQIDFDAKTLTLFHTTPKKVWSGSLVLPLQSVPGKPGLQVRVLIGGATAADLRLDTGAARSGLPVQSVAHLLPSAHITSLTNQVNGGYLTQLLFFHRLKIGSLPVPNVMVETIPPTAALVPIFGLDLLVHFQTLLDFRNHQMVLTPRSGRGFNGVVPGFIGILSSASEDGLQVTHLDPPAALSGLQIGDEILSVDGYALKGRPVGIANQLLKGVAETTARVGIRRGGVRYTVPIRRESAFGAVSHMGWSDGLVLVKRDVGETMVPLVLKGSAAEKAGFRSGDQIQSVNRQPPGQMNFEQLIQAMSRGQAAVVVQGKSGSSRSLTMP